MRYLSILCLCLLICSSGCVSTASFYCPNAINTPLLSEKYQAKFDGNVGIAGGKYSSSDFKDLSIAYSPIDHLGFLGDYHYFHSGYEAQSANDSANHLNNTARMGEFALGYYYSRGDNKLKFIGDIYGGLGFGKIETDGFMNGEMRMSRFFAQPGVGLGTNVFDASLNIRISNLSYSYSSPSAYNLNSINQYEIPPANRVGGLFVEPAITLRVGYKFVKFQGQIMGSLSDVPWCYDNTILSVGLHFSLEYLYLGYYNATSHIKQVRKDPVYEE